MSRQNLYKKVPGFSSVLRLALPIILSSLLAALHQLINAFWVGHIDQAAVAVVSLCFPLLMCVISIGSGVSVASGILVAHSYGAKNARGVDIATTHGLMLSTLLSILITVAGLLLAPVMLKGYSSDPAIIAAQQNYLRISLFGIPFTFIFLQVQATLNSIQKATLVLLLSLLSICLHIALDPLFIFGSRYSPAFGVEGAALGGVLADALIAIISLNILYAKKSKTDEKERRFNDEIIKRIVQLALPISAEQLFVALGVSVITTFVSTFGMSETIAFGVAIRVFIFAMIPATGIYVATSILVSQSLGRGEVADAEAIGYSSAKGSMIVLALFAALIYFLSSEIVYLFVPNMVLLREGTQHVVELMALALGLSGFRIGMLGLFRGSGNTPLTMAITLATTWFLQVPLAFTLSKIDSIGVEGVWISYPLASAISTVMTFLIFKSGKWKRAVDILTISTQQRNTHTTAEV